MDTSVHLINDDNPMSTYALTMENPGQHSNRGFLASPGVGEMMQMVVLTKKEEQLISLADADDTERMKKLLQVHVLRTT